MILVFNHLTYKLEAKIIFVVLLQVVNPLTKYPFCDTCW
jgi:hypothetical protein